MTKHPQDKPSVRLATRHQHDTASEEAISAETATVNDLPTLTEQHHREDVDLNVIVKRYGITDGSIPVAPMDPAFYGDFSEVTDLRTTLDRVRAAQEHFYALPAKLRERFGNNPAEMYRWVSQPENSEEAVRLGLLKREEEPKAPEPTRVILAGDERKREKDTRK